jgi:hypothetical protein
MTYTAQSPEIDEHALGKMRDWLTPKIECAGCVYAAEQADAEALLLFIENEYEHGVSGFLADLQAGNGELP